MKKLFSLFAAVLFVGSMMAEGLLFEQTYPGEPSAKVSSYSKSFTLTTSGYTLTYQNINNGTNNDAWDALRAGSKNGESEATVTSEAISEKVSKVVISFTQVDANKTKKLALLVADNENFTNAAEVEATIAVGDVAFTVAEPAENKFYRISIDQAQGSANGFNRFEKIQFISPEGGTPIVPEVYDTINVAKAKELAAQLDDKATSEKKYVVRGFAVNVENYKEQYGSQIFYMVDDVTAPDTEFQAYAAHPLKDDQIYPVLAGDEVFAFGKLKKYGEQLEIDNPVISFISEVEGERTIEPVAPVKLDTITVAEALEIAQALTPEKKKSATTEDKYAVKGIVVGISSKNENTFYLADEAGAYGEFEAYKCSSVDYQVLEGDYVIVTGKIQHYWGEGSEGDFHSYEISGGTLVHVFGEGIENVVLTEQAQKVMIDGAMFIIRNGKMYDVRGAQVR